MAIHNHLYELEEAAKEGGSVVKMPAAEVQLGKSDGKMSAFGVPSVVRPTAFTQTYSTASKTVPAITSLAAPAGGVGVAAGGWSSAADRDLAIASINAIRTNLESLYKVVTAMIDDLQAEGWLQ